MITFGKEISFEEYNELRRMVDWYEVSRRQFDVSIPNSRFRTAGRDDGKLISLARAVGDGGYHHAVRFAEPARRDEMKNVDRLFAVLFPDYPVFGERIVGFRQFLSPRRHYNALVLTRQCR